MQEGALTQDVTVLKAEKVRRYNEEQLRFYEPHSAQQNFHMSQAKIRAIVTGNQWGKTYAGCMDIAWTVGKCHPYRQLTVKGEPYYGPVKARDCCVTLKTLRTVLIPTYKKIVPRNECILNGKRFPGLLGGSWSKAWSEKDNALHFTDGSFIEFMSYEQGREAFQGSQMHIIRMDEEPKEDIYSENRARQITLGTNIIFTLTPLNYSQWLYNEIYEKSNGGEEVEMFTGATSENPYADPAVLEEMEKGIADPAERAARLRGEFTFVAGRVYKGYGDHNVCDPFPIPKGWHRTIIIDPHPDKATAVNWIAEDGGTGKMYCYREADIEGDVKHICDEIIAKSQGEYINLWLIDPSSRQAAKIHGKGRLLDEFRKYFPSLIEANNNREIGWEAMKKLIKDDPINGPKLYNFRTCTVTDFQMRNYSWKPPLKSGESRGKPEIYKKNDDHCDNWRYRSVWKGNIKTNHEDFGDIGVYANA